MVWMIFSVPEMTLLMGQCRSAGSDDMKYPSGPLKTCELQLNKS